MDRTRIVSELEATFGGSDRALRAVSRQARDLAESGRIQEDLGYELTVDAIVSNLGDAPTDYRLVERWNWWINSLELSHGAYQRFQVRTDLERQ